MLLLLHDLVRLTGGRLRLASMPPVHGVWEAVGRIVVQARDVQPGDVYWDLDGDDAGVQLAFFRGALGVVSSGSVEPWPGRFSLWVEDSHVAFEKAWTAIVAEAEGFLPEPPELKVLQLCGQRVPANFPPTCGQSAKGLAAPRCRQRAA